MAPSEISWHSLETEDALGRLDSTPKGWIPTLAAFQWFQAFNAKSHCQSVFSIGVADELLKVMGIHGRLPKTTG